MSFTNHATGAVIAMIIGFAAVLPASERDPPIDITEMTVATPEIAPGEMLLIRVTVDRERVCQTTAFVTIYDGANIEWVVEPDERPAFGPVGVETRLVGHLIPPGATPGPARYRLILDFRCNWTHDIAPVTMILPDLGFTILAPDVP